MTLALTHVLTAPSRQDVIDVYEDVRESRLIGARIAAVDSAAVSWVSFLDPAGEVCRLTFYPDGGAL